MFQEEVTAFGKARWPRRARDTSCCVLRFTPCSPRSSRLLLLGRPARCAPFQRQARHGHRGVPLPTALAQSCGRRPLPRVTGEDGQVRPRGQ